jgi:hypothetical protein
MLSNHGRCAADATANGFQSLNFVEMQRCLMKPLRFDTMTTPQRIFGPLCLLIIDDLCCFCRSKRSSFRVYMIIALPWNRNANPTLRVFHYSTSNLPQSPPSLFSCLVAFYFSFFFSSSSLYGCLIVKHQMSK